jgi:hypothetical protein
MLLDHQEIIKVEGTTEAEITEIETIEVLEEKKEKSKTL